MQNMENCNLLVLHLLFLASLKVVWFYHQKNFENYCVHLPQGVQLLKKSMNYIQKNEFLIISLVSYLIKMLSSFTKVITTIYFSQKNLYTRFLALCGKSLKCYLLKVITMDDHVWFQVYFQVKYHLSQQKQLNLKPLIFGKIKKIIKNTLFNHMNTMSEQSFASSLYLSEMILRAFEYFARSRSLYQAL